MQDSHNKAEQRFEEVQGEKERVEDECADLAEEITNKDSIIKTLTKENLQINSRVTQLQQLLCSQEDVAEKEQS